MALKFTDDLNENIKRINSMEEILGNTLNIPHAASNSGARKILANKQKEQSFFLMHGEVPYLSTGYENKYGDESSSMIKLNDDYRVVAKISKFSYAPDHHYWLILENPNTHKLDVCERIAYNFRTEVYGYLYNNKILDSMKPGMVIPRDTVIKKSLAYDDFNNKADGINCRTIYISDTRLTEDACMISKSTARRFAAPIFHPIEIKISPNLLPLNLYGKGEVYKSFPDIGERIENGVFMGLRLEKKEESLFSQSYERLKHLMLSDNKFVCNGTVIDIDIICNDFSLFESPYTAQLKSYYDDKMRLAREFVGTLLPYISQGYEMSYELERIYYPNKAIVDGAKFADDKVINNVILKVMVLEEKPAEVGDKIADRHGGKGVISTVLPDEEMPIYNGNHVDVLINKSTMYNRENHGQMWELSETFVGDELIRFIKTGVLEAKESMDMIIKYLKIVAPELGQETEDYTNSLNPDLLTWYLNTIIEEGHIYVASKPITENLDIFKLDKLYKEFPFINQVYLEMPQRDSNGNLRFVKSIRKFVPGIKYMYRLKQFAEEKFSVTNLAATTIKNENTRSHASKYYQEAFSDTPIKFGQMESDQFAHMGIDYVVSNLMLHSLSPHGRRLVEKMYTDNPFNIDIKLTDKCTNREVEILNAYLKTMGLRLVFYKTRKQKPPELWIEPFSFETPQEVIQPFEMINLDNFDQQAYLDYMKAHDDLMNKQLFHIDPCTYFPKEFYKNK